MPETLELKSLYFGDHDDAPEWAGRLVDEISPLMGTLGIPFDWAFKQEGDDTPVILMWMPVTSVPENPDDFDLPDIDDISVDIIEQCFEPCGSILLRRGRLMFEGVYDGNRVNLVIVHTFDPDTIEDIPEIWPWMAPVIEAMIDALSEEDKKSNPRLLN